MAIAPNRSADRPWRITGDGVALRVRLTPKSSRDAVAGIEETAAGPAIKARVTAIPQNGAANTALETLIAQWLEVPKRAVRLISGGKSRIKTVAIDGASARLVDDLITRTQSGAHPKD